MINSNEIRRMIDTGSTISAINASYFKKINNNQLIFPSATSSRTENNTKLKTLGRVILPININGNLIQMNSFILEDLCTELLLGATFVIRMMLVSVIAENVYQ